MSREATTPHLYNIPPGAGFAEALVRGVLDEAGDDPLALAQYRILLPTRRGCRVVRDMFLRLSDGQPLILPTLQTLGDIDEDELSLQLQTPQDLADFLSLKPAMPGTRRRLLLARLVQQSDKTLQYGQALGLADTLARLLDQVETEGLSLNDLPALVTDNDLATHWQHTITFLEIISKVWPAILEERGYMGPARRRDALLRLQARIWEARPPDGKIIAAGSTGSLPATGLLLKTIACLPQGRVILPGVDQDMDQAGWEAIDEGHPQATLRNLLQLIGVDRAQIPLWHAAAEKSEERSKKSRRLLASQMMRPAPETQSWTGLQPESLNLHEPRDIEKLQQNLWRIDCATPEEEARLISLALRQALETTGMTAALITPDRNLARRVAMACRRWGIEVDDSAGIPLGDTPIGTFLLLLLEACSKNLAPSALLPLLQHELCGFGENQSAREDAISHLDRYILRGPRPAPGIDGLRLHAAAKLNGPAAQKLAPLAGQINDIIDKIDHALTPLLQQNHQPGPAILRALIAAAETLADSPALPGDQRLWRGAAGESASSFLSDLLGHADELPPMPLYDMGEILSRMMAGIPVRTPVGVHPRLLVLGQLEARLVQADLMILGGLNEGSWPPDPGQDPWMSRPMRRQFGLPAPERSIALAAHDFVQCFCADRVIMTRAARVDGKPALPSRWLQRLDTVRQAAGLPADLLFPPAAQALLALARLGDRSTVVSPAPRPAPRPPAAHRLKRIAVTQVETLMTNPYGLYAREILRLPKLDPVEKPVDSAARGNFVHDVLHRFVAAYPDQLPDNAIQIIIDLGHAQRTAMADDSGAWDYWWPRFGRLAESFIGQEEQWRQEARTAKTEIKGRLDLSVGGNPLAVSVRADRIDRMHDGTYAVIDYKSAGTYRKSGMVSGAQPQLPLEALILQQGGFEALPAGPVGYVGYWKLTGGRKGIELIALRQEDGLKDVVESTAQGFRDLLETYARADTPFACRPDPARAPRFDDYRQLSRFEEWAHDEDSEGEDSH